MSFGYCGTNTFFNPEEIMLENIVICNVRWSPLDGSLFGFHCPTSYCLYMTATYSDCHRYRHHQNIFVQSSTPTSTPTSTPKCIVKPPLPFCRTFLLQTDVSSTVATADEPLFRGTRPEIALLPLLLLLIAAFSDFKKISINSHKRYSGCNLC